MEEAHPFLICSSPSIFIELLYYFMCFACMYCLCIMYVPGEPGIIGGCEPPCGLWELSPELLEDHPLLLTAEPLINPTHSISLTES